MRGKEGFKFIGRQRPGEMEALEFVEVPLARLDRDMDGLAERIINSDMVYFV